MLLLRSSLIFQSLYQFCRRQKIKVKKIQMVLDCFVWDSFELFLMFRALLYIHHKNNYYTDAIWLFPHKQSLPKTIGDTKSYISFKSLFKSKFDQKLIKLFFENLPTKQLCSVKIYCFFLSSIALSTEKACLNRNWNDF